MMNDLGLKPQHAALLKVDLWTSNKIGVLWTPTVNMYWCDLMRNAASCPLACLQCLKVLCLSSSFGLCRLNSRSASAPISALPTTQATSEGNFPSLHCLKAAVKIQSNSYFPSLFTSFHVLQSKVWNAKQLRQFSLLCQSGCIATHCCAAKEAHLFGQEPDTDDEVVQEALEESKPRKP